MRWFWIFVGGGLGSVLRVALSLWVLDRTGDAMPWGTLAANGLGCCAIGAIAGWAEIRSPHSMAVALLIPGFLGGFTTFSTFGLETWQLIEAERWIAAALNATLSVVLGLIGVAVGLTAARATA